MHTQEIKIMLDKYFPPAGTTTPSYTAKVRWYRRNTEKTEPVEPPADCPRRRRTDRDIMG